MDLDLVKCAGNTPKGHLQQRLRCHDSDPAAKKDVNTLGNPPVFHEVRIVSNTESTMYSNQIIKLVPPMVPDRFLYPHLLACMVQPIDFRRAYVITYK